MDNTMDTNQFAAKQDLQTLKHELKTELKTELKREIVDEISLLLADVMTTIGFSFQRLQTQIWWYDGLYHHCCHTSKGAVL